MASSNSSTPQSACASVCIPGADLLKLGIVVAGNSLAHDELFVFEAAGRWHVCGNRTVYAATDV